MRVSMGLLCLAAALALAAHAATAAYKPKTLTVTWITPRPQVKGVYTQAMRACVGDTVDFAWDHLVHNLGAAPKAFFDTCAPALLPTWKRLSPDTNKYSKKVKMSKAGKFYYVCTVTDHCTKGHKIAITVKKC